MGGTVLDVPAPWGWLDGLPLFDSVVPTRLALVVTPVVGCVLAIAVRRYGEIGDPSASARPARWTAGEVGAEVGVVRLMGVVVLAMVLVPLTPTPLPVFERPFVPAFFTAGMYREYVPRDGVVLGVPPGWSPSLHAMQWQTAADLEFTIFGGYFLAPDPNDPKTPGDVRAGVPAHGVDDRADRRVGRGGRGDAGGARPGGGRLPDDRGDDPGHAGTPLAGRRAAHVRRRPGRAGAAGRRRCGSGMCGR